MTQRTYYKVLKIKGGELKSSQIWSTDAEIIYKVGEWVKPKIEHSKIFVFDNLLDARNFAPEDNRIYTCHIKGKPTRMRIKCDTWSFSCILERFWLNKKSHKKQTDNGLSMYIPTGTVLVDQVKLLKEI